MICRLSGLLTLGKLLMGLAKQEQAIGGSGRRILSGAVVVGPILVRIGWERGLVPLFILLVVVLPKSAR